jgi:hypothetical protein
MHLARAISAFAILVFFSIFVFLNTKSTGGSAGEEFIFLSLVMFGVLLIISGNLGNFFLWRMAAVLIAVFFVYFSAKWYMETGSAYNVWRVTLATSSGVIFAFFLGLIVSQALSAIYDLRKDTQSSAVLYLMATSYALLVLAFAVMVFMAHRGNLTRDIFLVDEIQSYQRVGDLFSMQFLALTSLVCVISVTSKRKRFNFALIPTVILSIVCGLYAITSQLLGSNKGLVVPVGVFFVYLAVILAGSSPRQRTRRTSILNILFSGMVFKLLFASLVGLVLVVVLGEAVLQAVGIDAESLRITGFGSGEVSSIDSRSEIFGNNFYLHFMHSPIFGNTQIELLTTGPGTYVHSTLSILTHLGVVGFLIFLGVLLSIYLEISYSFKAKYSSIFGNQTFSLFRLLCLFAVLIMGMFSAFFTWMPLWFALGLFGNWYHQIRVRSQILDKSRASGRKRRHHKPRVVPGHK